MARAVALIVSVALLTACRQAEPPSVTQETYQVRVSVLVAGRALTQSGQSFARVCAPSPPDITFTVVDAQNGPENLKNVDDGRADVAFVATSLLYEGYQGILPEYPERFEKIGGLAVLQPL